MRTDDATNRDTLIEAGIPEDLADFLVDSTDGVVGVFFYDWRDEDEEIVRQVIQLIPNAGLTYRPTDEPLDIVLSYRGKETSVGLTISPLDRIVTVAGINRALAGEYELRVFRWCLQGEDNTYILVMTLSAWTRAEAAFPEKVAETFIRADAVVEMQSKAPPIPPRPGFVPVKPPRKQRIPDVAIAGVVIVIALIGILISGFTSEPSPLLIAIMVGFAVVKAIAVINRRP